MAKSNPVVKAKLNFDMHPGQQEIDSCTARFKVVMTGVRFGKTSYSFKYLLDGAIKRPGSKNWIIFPFAKQGRSVAWRKMLEFIPDKFKKGKPNNTNMDIPLINGSEMGIRGSDNYKSLLGEKLGRVVLDEAARQKSIVWEEIIRQRLIDYRGEALFISTPYGKNWFYKLWELGNTKTDAEWRSFHFTSYCNTKLPGLKEELDKLKLTTPPRLWKREIMGEALEDEGLVYGEYGKKNDFDHSTDFKNHEYTTQCGRGIDWGYGVHGDPAACMWVHISDTDILVSQEHVQANWSVPKQTDAIKEKSEGRRVIEGMTVIDQSAFKAEGSSTTTVGKLFGENGVPCVPGSKNKDSGISIVKALLEGQPGKARLLISDNCPLLKEAFLSWEFGQHEPDPLAALRYILVAMHRRGLFKLENIYNNSVESSEHLFNPHSIFDQRKLRERMEQENQELAWEQFED